MVNSIHHLEIVLQFLRMGLDTGTFTTVNLPLPPPQAGMEWEIEYGSNALVLTAASTNTYLFLPMVIR